MTVSDLIAAAADVDRLAVVQSADPGEVFASGVPHGCLTITYRSGGQDRFPGVPAATAGKIVEKVHDSRAFSGTLVIEGADCIGVINAAEVESIIFHEHASEDQP